MATMSISQQTSMDAYEESSQNDEPNFDGSDMNDDATQQSDKTNKPLISRSKNQSKIEDLPDFLEALLQE